MARVVTDADAVLQKMLKQKQMNTFMTDFVQRNVPLLEQHPTTSGFTRKFYIQYITLQKRHSSLVEDIYTDVSQIVRGIERWRLKRLDLSFMQQDYDHFAWALDHYGKIRRDVVNELRETAQLMDEFNILLTDNQLQTALSIPVKAWNRLYETGRVPFVVGGYSA